jgi:hypothetical protein
MWTSNKWPGEQPDLDMVMFDLRRTNENLAHLEAWHRTDAKLFQDLENAREEIARLRREKVSPTGRKSSFILRLEAQLLFQSHCGKELSRLEEKRANLEAGTFDTQAAKIDEIDRARNAKIADQSIEFAKAAMEAEAHERGELDPEEWMDRKRE